MNRQTIQSALTIPQSVMQLAETWALARSKDPSTKVGAAVYDGSTGSVHLGYNGFPSGMPDYREVWERREGIEGRLTKYDCVIHAEANAIRKALMAGFDPKRSFIAVTHAPCAHCVKEWIVASGIKKVFVSSGQLIGLRWEHENAVACVIMREAGVTMESVKVPTTTNEGS